jgi:hypothetical protein
VAAGAPPGRSRPARGSAAAPAALLDPAFRARRDRFGLQDDRTREVAGYLSRCLRRLGRDSEADALGG